jgi:predicted DNA-binding transcriptional regulator YafY
MAKTLSDNEVSFSPQFDNCGHMRSAICGRMRRIMVQTSARLLALLSLLQVRREWTGQELADRLEVGPRTIRRDVDKLRSLGYPIEAAPGVAGGYRLGNGGELPPLLLDDAEAVAVAVGLRTAAAGGIAGIEETSVRALSKLEQVLPGRLRRRVSALSAATAAFGVEGPQIDSDVLASLAGACRDQTRLRFSYVARDEKSSTRLAEPAAVVYSGHRWYLVAFDLDRDDWRTFRLDRIRGRVRIGERGRRRVVPGGDAAAYVRERLRGAREGETSEFPPGRIRVGVPASRMRSRVPGRYATVEPDGEAACIVTSRGAWSRGFLVWMAMLDEPMEVLDPPEMVAAAQAAAARLAPA